MIINSNDQWLIFPDENLFTQVFERKSIKLLCMLQGRCNNQPINGHHEDIIKNEYEASKTGSLDTELNTNGKIWFMKKGKI